VVSHFGGEQLLMLLSGYEYDISIGGVSASFHLPSADQYNRIDNTYNREKKIMADLLDHCREDDVFYDVGANVGIYTCLVGQRLSASGTIVGFEPVPELAHETRRNAFLNGVSHRLFEVALSDKKGISRFYLREGTAGHGLDNSETGDISGAIEVDVVDGGDFVDVLPVPEPTIMKIDVEGAEYDVLAGLEPVLDSLRHVYVEMHRTDLEDFGHSEQEVYDLLESRGFEITHLDHTEISDRPFIRASK